MINCNVSDRLVSILAVFCMLISSKKDLQSQHVRSCSGTVTMHYITHDTLNVSAECNQWLFIFLQDFIISYMYLEYKIVAFYGVQPI